MRRKHDTDEQIGFALRQAEAGMLIGEVSRKTGIAEQSFSRLQQELSTNE